MTANSGGFASIAFTLSDDPLLVGGVHTQCVYRNVGANPANLQATRGLSVR